MFVHTGSCARPFFRLGFRANPPLSAAGAGTGQDDDNITGLVAMDGSLQGKYREGGATGKSVVACTDDGMQKVWLYLVCVSARLEVLGRVAQSCLSPQNIAVAFCVYLSARHSIG